MIADFFSRFRGMIFDLDGTLVSSSHIWGEVDEKFLSKRGITVPDDYFKAVSAMDFPAAAVYTNERFSLGEDPRDIQAEWMQMVLYEYSHNVWLKDGAEDLLRELSKQGKKLALATSAPPRLYLAALENNGVAQLFDFFADTGKVARGKAYPDVYEYAAKGLGLLPCECVVFEDIIEGVRSSKAGGFCAAACLDEHYIADWEDMKKESDLYFRSFRELM